MYIPEWEIENAIVWNPSLVEISGRLEKLSFIENQKYLKNTGRYIDILFKSDDKLVIVEVKCIYIDEPAIIFDQVLEYKKELSAELGIPMENIACSLVSPIGFSEEVLNLCNSLGIFTKKLDENEIICSSPKNKRKVKSEISENIKNDLKININKFKKILKKRSSNFSNFELTNEPLKDEKIINEIESIKTFKNSGIHDELAKKRIGEIFTEISKNAPIRAHEVNTNSDGRLVDNYDKWFWLFYSVMDRRSNAANFVKAKEALEKKDLFNPYKIIKLIREKDEKTAINRIASILENSRFPLMRDSTMGDLAFPRSIVEAARFISKYDYDFERLYVHHFDDSNGNPYIAYKTLRKELEESIYGVGPRISSQFIRGMVLKGSWNLPLTDDKLLEMCKFNIRFASKMRLGLIEDEGAYYSDLGRFADEYLGGNRAIISHALWYVRKRYCDKKIMCDECKLAGYCGYFLKTVQDEPVKKDLSWFVS
ncbi:MAG: hypothetical protein O8C63_07730 [Candidatus Methanoperedens sp.]|nr:hypothetical protein [Candidatus Methanoperedens sp.]